MTSPNFSDARIEEGIRLFNECQFFACHDVLEDYWSEVVGPEKSFFQGLIQAAVALFHFEGGNFGGACRMYASSREYMSPSAEGIAGINVAKLLEDMKTCFAELCVPRSSYPTDVQLNPNLIPRIDRDNQPYSQSGIADDF